MQPSRTASALVRLVTEAPPKLADALCALLERLAHHPRQPVDGGGSYVELSVGYIRCLADVGYETARRAWHAALGILGWESLHVEQIRALGLTLRERPVGGLWGQHLLVPPEAERAVRLAVDALALPARRTADPGTWAPVDVVARAGRMFTRCPFHNDRDPSMLLNPNGSGVCFGCCGADERPLRVCWRNVDGTVRVAPAIGHRKDVVPCTESRTGRIENPPPGPGARCPLVLGALYGDADGCWSGPTGMRRSESRATTLLGLLAHADRLASGHAERTAMHEAMAAWEASGENDPRLHLPDRYVSVDRMQAVGWRTFAARGQQVHVPVRWEPAVLEHVLVDLDGFDSAPTGNRTLADAGVVLARWAATVPWLSGAVAVIRTSHLGVQAVFGVAGRHDPRAWHADPANKARLRELDAVVLAAVRGAGFTGGAADPSAHAAGRLMRRPGARVAKDGLPYVSRLAFSTTSAATGERAAWSADRSSRRSAAPGWRPAPEGSSS
jgi:hypothetical protein